MITPKLYITIKSWSVEIDVSNENVGQEPGLWIYRDFRNCRYWQVLVMVDSSCRKKSRWKGTTFICTDRDDSRIVSRSYSSCPHDSWSPLWGLEKGIYIGSPSFPSSREVLWHALQEAKFGLARNRWES